MVDLDKARAEAAEGRELADKATDEPWDWDQGDNGNEYSHPYCSVSVDGGNLIIADVNDRFSTEQGRDNAAFIADARTRVLILATHVNALADEVERLKGDLAVTNTGGLKLLYDIRRELGFNEYFPLSHLDTKARDVKARAKRLAEVAKVVDDHRECWSCPTLSLALAALEKGDL